MTLIEYILVSFSALVSIVSAVTDVKIQKIKNKIIIPAIIIAFAANLTNSVMTDNVAAYIRNVIFISAFGIILYAMRFMGAGDSKFLAFIIAAMPVGLYSQRVGGYFSSIIILIYIFSICFVYVCGESIYLFMKSEKASSIAGGISLLSFAWSFIKGMTVVTAVNEVFWLLFNNFYQSNQYVIVLINFIVVNKISEEKVSINKLIMLAMLLSEIVFAFVTPYGERFKGSDYRYLFVCIGLIAVRQLFMNRYNYKEIDTSSVKPGMVLSVQTTMLMSKSRVKGLPGLSTEDYKSRINESEVESIKRWETSKYGSDKIVIVRQLPLGLFISLGNIIFLAKGVISLLCNS